MNEKVLANLWDLINKLALVAIPVVLGWFLNSGSQRIADSLQNRQFIQSMIDQLSDLRSRTRQDIALILLNEELGREQPRMVARIAEVVYDDNLERVRKSKTGDPVSEAQGSTAYEILAELDPPRAKQISQDSQQRVLASLLDQVNDGQ
ncbi:MAG: hypothetical protein C4332_05635 [Meiothermus sp.]